MRIEKSVLEAKCDSCGGEMLFYSREDDVDEVKE